jgi:hypothetical protein
MMAAPGPAQAAGKGANLGVFVSGPAALLIVLAPIAAVAAILAVIGRLDAVAATALRAQERLQQSWTMPLAWGAAAAILVIVAAVILFKTKVLALIGVALLAAGILLLGLGTVAGALTVGGRLLESSGEYDRQPLDHLRIGLWTLLAGAVCPLLGWLAALAAALAGTGAVLEAIVTRER